MGPALICKAICCIIAISLIIVKLLSKDKHTAIYWTAVAVYWFVNILDGLLK